MAQDRPLPRTALNMNAILFIVASTALMAFPFVPAWREWRRPSDHAALPVPVSYISEASHFANELRANVNARAVAVRVLEPHQMVCAEASGDPGSSGRPGDFVVPKWPGNGAAPIHSQGVVYAAADFQAPDRSTFSAVMSTGRLDIGCESQITEWAHADGALHLGGHSVGLRRLSSGEAIDLDRGCCFERIHAPVVRFGSGDGHALVAQRQAPERRECAQLAGARSITESFYRFDGDCTVPEGGHYVGSLIISGILVVGAGSVIEGDVKAHKGILLEPGAEVRGSVICSSAIHFLQGAAAKGPVASETTVMLASGCCVGSAAAPTTITASSILVESGAVAHGTVWARSMGVVWGLA